MQYLNIPAIHTLSPSPTDSRLPDDFQLKRTAVNGNHHLRRLPFVHSSEATPTSHYKYRHRTFLTLRNLYHYLVRLSSIIAMRYFRTVAVVAATLTLVSAIPHHLAPSLVDNALEMPMHTTALMAGAAWDLTHSATATRTLGTMPTTAVTKATGLGDQYEL